MRLTSIFVLLLFLLTNQGSGQTRTITGRVIDESLSPVYGAAINNADTLRLATTDLQGNFKIDIPADTRSLTINWVGVEPKLIHLPGNCDHLEVIMLYAGSYDFMTARKVDRLRKKEFKKLPGLHRDAFSKGLFTTEKPCYEEKFISRFRKNGEN